MIILFQNILFSNFWHALAVLSYLSKLKRGVSTFWCTFSAYFFHINVPYLIPYQLTKFQYQTRFPSQNIKQYIFLNSYRIDNVMTLEFIFSHLLKLWLTEGNKGHQGNPKIWISREQKKLLRAVICWKKERQQTQALSWTGCYKYQKFSSAFLVLTFFEVCNLRGGFEPW